ncbi:gamma-mobile-trio protein GmtX [Rheinheimera sp.]|uniref:gamma-mobile-trio protein GmtX n=1 Tax=Rheinheimera sp. TaxID=1869214 RepID=UPI0037CA715D
MDELTPERVLNQLKKLSSPRICATLDAVFAVCKEQQERGLLDFSYTTIAKLGKDRGVPAAQSIRNKTGEAYRALIKVFENTVVKPKSKPKNPTGKNVEWINNISDPVLKLQVNYLYAQKREAERLLEKVVPINQVIEIYDGASSAISKIMLTDLEREALQYLLSSEFLRENGYELGADASVVSAQTKKMVFPVATLDALKKAMLNL